jgi:hypothetical protein
MAFSCCPQGNTTLQRFSFIFGLQIGDDTTWERRTPVAISGPGSIAFNRVFNFCPCRSQVKNTAFTITNADRVAAKKGASAVFSFQTTDLGKLVGGSNITLSYPSGFFDTSTTPGVMFSEGGTGVAHAPTETFIVITTGNVVLSANTKITITLTGLTMGTFTCGSHTGITIATSSDPSPSSPISSGHIWPVLAHFSQPPISNSLIAHYNADSWTGTQWFDLSGADNHVMDVGGTRIAVARPVQAPAFIYGNSTSWMKFPATVLPSANYTLFFVARYNGISRKRIFQGQTSNWYSGFSTGKSGTAYHGDACGFIVLTACANQPCDLHGVDWVLGSDRSDSFRSNGVNRTARTSLNERCATHDRIGINSGVNAGESSDFAIQSLLVYSSKLSDADVQIVEAWLIAKQPMFTPANLQARDPHRFIFHHFSFLLW